MSAKQYHDYHLVDPSPWPIFGAISALIFFIGVLFFMHGVKFGEVHLGHLVMPGGFALVVFTMYVWWKDVIHEGIHGGHHKQIVRHGLRIGMALFILSEVMFFFAFFWSFFKSALIPVLVFDGANIFDSAIPVVQGMWPPKGIETFDPWDLPLMNTLVLALSSCTVTWAHYSVLKNDQKGTVQALFWTVLLGVSFTCLQALEYSHAPFGFKDGIYSSNFYMATGFHGAHVVIGTTFLAVCLYRAIKGQFSPEGHLGLEFAAWYWHFVDVVWIFLFTFVYVWGA